MKKKFQAAENYLTAQTKGFQEQLDFIKTQGAFFEKAMYPLERQREQCRFIIDNFKRSAMQLPFPALPEENAVEVREWPRLSSLKNTEQLLTQEKMETICKNIMNDAYSDDPNILFPYVIIEFEEGHVIWDEMLVPMNDAVIEIEILSVDPLGSRKDCFEIRFGDRLRGTIYMCDRNGSTIAFLKATGDDGKDYYFELEHFSMLFLRLHDSEDENEKSDCKNDDPGHSEDPAAEDSGNGLMGMFTLFNRRNGLLFTTGY